MKKLLLALFVAVSTISAAYAGCTVGFWVDAPHNISLRDAHGIALGVPMANVRSADGAELSILAGFAGEMRGFQGTFFGITRAGILSGCQLAFANFLTEKPERTAVQVGFYNQSSRGGIQIGLVNNGQDAARFQFGLVCINKNGFFPFMIFFNFSR